ncbi:peptidylprolyl isomerase [Puniceibacterium sp. IMCC21224]|uniref:peptidylprolyl isomerase n=1 Tax=Puniceibacterium sp. IMCC21224 TaxID=1618204 RepID=UPI00064DEBED|nr:peptidylprolyl isomerase [Puniceibacterium sp. IMCC21224]KMK67245.1 SurA N-terminal domain/PPIC-type PPIASE domain [Puniceibacterium sp. IMCC21224]
MARKSGSLSKTVVWIILALVIVGLGGFGAVNLSGSVRSIGSVGNLSISVDSYARALQNEIRAFEGQTGQQMTFAQAQQIGLDTQVLGQLVTARAFDFEADRLGLSVGDAALAQDLAQIAAFQGPDGKFSRDAYRFALQNAGLSEAEFEADLRSDSARTLLQGAILAGNALPAIYADTLIAYAGERRAFTYATLGDSSLPTGVAEASDEDLQTYYDANIANYTRPETKQITYVWLTPEMILDSVEVDETALKQAFDDRADQYIVPERRLVERLVFADDATAADAAAQLAAGDTDFETLVEDRGLSLGDVDLGDVTRAGLGAAADAVFDAAPGDIVGPQPSSLGPALFRVNGVLAAQSTSYEEALPDLRDELALDRARRVIETQAQDYDDLLAGGATLEDLAQETEMQLAKIDWAEDTDTDIAAYNSFRAAAAALTTDDFPKIDQLGDGGVFAMRLDTLLAPAPYPLDDVRDRVRTGWETEQKTQSLSSAAEALVAQLGEGRTFEALGLATTAEEGLTRNAAPDGLPTGLLQEAFEMETGDLRVVPGNGEVRILRLNAVLPADRGTADAQTLAENLSDQAANDVAQDLFRAVATDIQGRAGVEINQQALNAVHTQLP